MNSKATWWAIHTQSGHENFVARTIKEKAEEAGISYLIEDIFVPKEDAPYKRKNGTEVKREKKFFPGYILIKMILNEKTWFLIRSIPYVTGFVGARARPRPVSEEEVEELRRKIETGEIKKTLEISRGDRVRIVDGPFKNFTGIVEDITKDKSRMRILVTVFGRQTPIDIESSQVEKIT